MGVSRRALLRGVAGTSGVAVAGCSGDGGGDTESDADVIAGPDGRLAFEPEELTVEAGDPVTWFFDTAGHNVSGRPEDSPEVSLPEGAEPFSSYGPDEPPQTLVPRDGIYEHTFEIEGTYVYVCIPHVEDDMVGRIVVEG